MTSKEIGQNIKRLRKAKKMTQAQLGEVIGVGQFAVCQYEIGRTRVPFETGARIADALGVTLNELAGAEDPYKRGYEDGRRDATKEIANVLLNFIGGQDEHH